MTRKWGRKIQGKLDFVPGVPGDLVNSFPNSSNIRYHFLTHPRSLSFLSWSNPHDVLRGFFGSTLHHYSTAGFKTFSFLLPQALFAKKVRAESPRHSWQRLRGIEATRDPLFAKTRSRNWSRIDKTQASQTHVTTLVWLVSRYKRHPLRSMLYKK